MQTTTITIKSLITLPVFQHALATDTEWLSFPLLEGIAKEVPEEMRWFADNRFEFESFMGHEVKEVRIGQGYLHDKPHVMAYIRLDAEAIDEVRDNLPTIDHYVGVSIVGDFEELPRKVEKEGNTHILTCINRPYTLSDVQGQLKISFSYDQREGYGRAF